MIVGAFDARGRSYLPGRLRIPRLGVVGNIVFQVDTGADVTCLHPRDGVRLGIPFDRLDDNRVSNSSGVGGTSQYFRESSFLVFSTIQGGLEVRPVELHIAKPNGVNEGLPSLLGVDVINHWRMDYDPRNNRLQFIVG